MTGQVMVMVMVMVLWCRGAFALVYGRSQNMRLGGNGLIFRYHVNCDLYISGTFTCTC
jgi:hypothetical protein